jgi:hypothetical protein
MYMLFVQEICSFCGQGQVGFTLCADQETVVLVCDECYAVWSDPMETRAEFALFPDLQNFTIPGLNCSLAGARWAKKEEIVQQGWSNYIAGEKEIPDQS